MKDLEEDTLNYKLKLNLYDEDIDFEINSDYNLFRKKVCLILKISGEELDSLLLGYIDEDGDNIRLSTEDDYDIFFQQVKNKTVNRIKIKFSNNSKLDQSKCIKCLEDALNYQEEHSKVYTNVGDDDKLNKININNNQIDEDKTNLNLNDNNNIINIDNNINYNNKEEEDNNKNK